MRSMIALFALALLAAPVAARTPIEADYVEARTASVFAGACHFNGEVVTTGREALLAWRIVRGEWNGIDLAGARAVAVVASEDTLANGAAVRRSELVVDAENERQAQALVAALTSAGSEALGRIERVRRAPIRFEPTDGGVEVSAERIAQLSIDALPNGECCKQPHLVWYSPLVQLEARKVGFTNRAWYAGGIGPSWERSGENGAFYGRLVFTP